MPTRVCVDCLRIFIAYANRGDRCRACKPLRIASQKLESQRKRLHAKRRNEQSADISDEEIELRFAAALKEIRSRPVKAEEQRRSYRWLYQEPGC